MQHSVSVITPLGRFAVYQGMWKGSVTVTNRDLKFAEVYIACGNAKQAAIAAGYSEKTAEYASNWLNPRKPKKYKQELADYIRQLSEEQQNERILTAGERKALLSDIAKGGAFDADRIRAIDTLNKMTGEYVTKIEGNISADVNNPYKDLTTEELRRLAE